jgi:hypothetical protein
VLICARIIPATLNFGRPVSLNASSVCSLSAFSLLE